MPADDVHHPWEEAFVQSMVRHRQALGVSQTGLAKQLSAQGLPFHPQTVQRIEAGDRPVRLNEAVLIIQALHMSEDGSIGLDAALSGSWVTKLVTLRRVFDQAQAHLRAADRTFDHDAERAMELGRMLLESLDDAPLPPGDELADLCQDLVAELGAFVRAHGAYRAEVDRG